MAALTIDHLSGGRFILGLGSQIKPHITKRFSMEWSHPAARMREMVLARDIETRLLKPDILYLYLNQNYFGHGAYGIGEAAPRHRDEHTRDLGGGARCQQLGGSGPPWQRVSDPGGDPVDESLDDLDRFEARLRAEAPRLAAIDGIVRRLQREIGRKPARVIPTGGLASLVARDSETIGAVDEALTLRGLLRIAARASF